MENERKAESARRNGQSLYGLLLAVALSGIFASLVGLEEDAVTNQKARDESITPTPTLQPDLTPTPAATIDRHMRDGKAYNPFNRINLARR